MAITSADDVLAMMAAGTSLDDNICSLDSGIFVTDDPLFSDMLGTMPLDPETEWQVPAGDLSEASLLAEMLHQFDGSEITAGDLFESESLDCEELTRSELAVDEQRVSELITEDNTGDFDGTDGEHTEYDDGDDNQELALLQKECQYLEAQKEYLYVRAKRTSVRKSRGARRGNRTAAQPEFSRDASDIARRTADNDVMRQLAAQQQFMMSNMRAMLSFAPVNDVRLSLMTPMESFIHLGSDIQERRNTIMRMRDEKLDIACKYLLQKSEGLDMELPYRYQDVFERFGKLYRVDFVQMKFDNVQVCDIVEILRNSHPPDNASYDEFGCTTTKEFCDSDQVTFKHHRIFSRIKLTTTSPVVESNMLMLFQDVDSEGRAVITADSIDKDDLYPYDSDNHIRMDTSFGWMFEPYIDSKGVQGVVMKRFVLSRCHMHQARMTKDAKDVVLAKVGRIFEGRLQRFINLFQARGALSAI